MNSYSVLQRQITTKRNYGHKNSLPSPIGDGRESENNVFHDWWTRIFELPFKLPP